MKIGAIIAAGGSSQRFGSDKLSLELNGRSVLAWSQKAMLENNHIERCVTVCSDIEYYKKIGIESSYMSYQKGGSVREESVFNGLTLLLDYDIVLVHDAARPFVSQRIIDELIANSNQAACVIPVVPCTSAIKTQNMGFITDNLAGKYILAQTPQLVWVKPLKIAMEKNKGSLESFPDESSLIASMGLHIKSVPGSSANIKITNPDDEVIAKALANQLFRVVK
jgi:2-C-methyl-D-erythritol 4-phosphate cytidylyltransferase